MSLVTLEDIRAIPERYKIGKRPLSLLLGWGELTYTRLLAGNTPTYAHALELRHLLDDPAAYARALELGRSRVTDAAYVRSFNAVNSLLKDEGGAARVYRIYSVADRLCMLAEGDLTPSALQRLVYYAQGLGFAQLSKALFDDLPRASALGPAYDRIDASYSFDMIQLAWKAGAEDQGLSERMATEALTSDELRVVDGAYKLYGSYSGSALSRKSREETPWRKARKRAGAAEGQDCEELLTAKSMRKFFAKGK